MNFISQPSFYRYPRVLALVLAGGKGTRLYPLTKYRAKPAVPVFAKYRIIDFVLSNLVNSGIFSIYILTQYKAQSLSDHIEQGWQFGSALRSRDFFISLAPAQMWTGEQWYLGTADAVYQNLHLVSTFDPDEILIFSADHIYKMDIRPMRELHWDRFSDLTIACFPVPKEESHNYGILVVDENQNLLDFVEKPRKNPPTLPDNPNLCLASMGNYIFSREALELALIEDSKNLESSHDFGKDIIPWMLKKGFKILAYDFTQNLIPGEYEPYWRDVGTIESYWQAHMEVLDPERPKFNLYNPKWPIRTVSFRDPPPIIRSGKKSKPLVIDSVIAEGSIIEGAKVIKSFIGRQVVIEENAYIEESIIFYGVRIGRNSKIRRSIIDKRVRIPPNSTIGFSRQEDESKGYTVTDSGITVVPAPPPQLRTTHSWIS